MVLLRDNSQSLPLLHAHPEEDSFRYHLPGEFGGKMTLATWQHSAESEEKCYSHQCTLAQVCRGTPEAVFARPAYRAPVGHLCSWGVPHDSVEKLPALFRSSIRECGPDNVHVPQLTDMDYGLAVRTILGLSFENVEGCLSRIYASLACFSPSLLAGNCCLGTPGSWFLAARCAPSLVGGGKS